MCVVTLLLIAVCIIGWLWTTQGAAGAEQPVIGTPPPEGVVELVGIAGMSNSLIELNDGSLLMNDGRISTDGGQTWSPGRSFDEGVSGRGLLRLQSGALMLIQGVGYEEGKIWISTDEGNSWEPRCPVKTPGGPAYALANVMIQLRSGRLLYCWDYNMSGNHPDIEPKAKAAATWKGQPYITETHQHRPEFFASGFSWSDDEGNTWTVGTRSGMPNMLMCWFDFNGEPNGMCGINPIGESSIAELKDGRVLLFGRTVVGRIAYSTSSDQGESWRAARPAELAASGSPPRLRRILKTGDLLCVWNQVSGEEIRRGYRRGRLSAAISKDDGKTWENFKTIEVSEGLDKVDRVYPDAKIQMVRARKDIGELPDGFAYFHYPNICVAGDKVYIIYSRGAPQFGIAEQNLNKQEQVMRIYPLKWFYE